MKLIKCILLLFPMLMFSQAILKGEIANSGDNEGIHVFNKTYQKYTITDVDGQFEIEARVNDTIVFSALQYQLKQIVVTSKTLKSDFSHVLLEEQVNELDAVYIKPKLSGDLLADTQRIKTKELFTAKTIGLPNAHVKPPTTSERKLYTATHSGGGLPIDAIINAISGRTKQLKKHIQLERKAVLEHSVYDTFEHTMLNDFNIPKSKIYDFLYYASSDSLFKQIVQTNSNIIIYDFLKTKAKTYINLTTSD
ncbi:MAG: carboxypeptidase-like regulatory domain-containing protein [Flavobacteriaceae bacterium]